VIECYQVSVLEVIFLRLCNVFRLGGGMHSAAGVEGIGRDVEHAHDLDWLVHGN
jgi:hypothetical protein